ncbi:MAG: hypothetical protein AABX48_03850 [Nanoarchaeota archaeon]
MERIDKDIKERVMNAVNKANSGEYEIRWNEKGGYDLKKKTEIKKGKKSRASGAKFENKVRENLERMGWIVAKWTNNVEFKEVQEHA